MVNGAEHVMSRFWLIIFAIIIILAAALLLVWLKISSVETGISYLGCWSMDGTDADEEMRDESIEALSGRRMVFSTNANVPRVIGKITEGKNILDVLGVPESVQPGGITIGIVPSRDEWNIAYTEFGDNGVPQRVNYVTCGMGTFINDVISANGWYIAATNFTENKQHVIRVDISENVINPVAYSNFNDRWPGISTNGSRVLFHSFRDGNPGGDLYLAEHNPDLTGGWYVTRLTNDSVKEYVWPRMSADGRYVAVFEKDTSAGFEFGRLAVYGLENWELTFITYLTEETDSAMFPSLSGDGALICWQQQDESRQWRVMVHDMMSGESRMLVPGYQVLESDVQWKYPAITPDGKFVTFVETNSASPGGKLGIYDMESEVVHRYGGCDGNFMFPSLSDRM